jgi:hypothetical protein
MVKVHDDLKEALDGEISIVDLYRHPTVSTLAGFLSKNQDPTASLNVVMDRAQKQKAAQNHRQQMMKRRTKR